MNIFLLKLIFDKITYHLNKYNQYLFLFNPHTWGRYLLVCDKVGLTPGVRLYCLTITDFFYLRPCDTLSPIKNLKYRNKNRGKKKATNQNPVILLNISFILFYYIFFVGCLLLLSSIFILVFQILNEDGLSKFGRGSNSWNFFRKFLRFLEIEKKIQ